MATNKQAITKHLEQIGYSNISFEDNTNGTNKSVGDINYHIIQAEKDKKLQNFYVVIETPQTNLFHGILPKKGLSITTHIQKAGERLHSVYDKFGEEIKVRFPKILLKGIIDVTEIIDGKKVELQKAFYICEKASGTLLSYDPTKEFDPAIAYRQGREFSAGMMVLDNIFHSETAKKRIANKDPYDPAHQIRKLKKIYNPETGEFSERLNILAQNLRERNELPISSDKNDLELTKDFIFAHIDRCREVQVKYKELKKQHAKLAKGHIHCDTYYDNILNDESFSTIIDNEEMGRRGYRAADAAVGINAREGVDLETGKLNEVGKAYLKGVLSVVDLGADYAKHLQLFLENGRNYIATMRIGHYTKNPKRSPVAEIEKGQAIKEKFSFNENEIDTPSPTQTLSEKARVIRIGQTPSWQRV